MKRLPVVLVLEDSADQRELVAEALVDQGFDVAFAESGLAGINAAASILPDVIVMDRALPLIDAWEVAKRIKAHPMIGHTPIIALTANALMPSMMGALEAGCDAFLVKPCTLEALLATVRRLVRHTIQNLTTPPKGRRIELRAGR